jgi:hypothetical protein
MLKDPKKKEEPREAQPDGQNIPDTEAGRTRQFEIDDRGKPVVTQDAIATVALYQWSSVAFTQTLKASYAGDEFCTFHRKVIRHVISSATPSLQSGTSPLMPVFEDYECVRQMVRFSPILLVARSHTDDVADRALEDC